MYIVLPDPCQYTAPIKTFSNRTLVSVLCKYYFLSLFFPLFQPQRNRNMAKTSRQVQPHSADQMVSDRLVHTGTATSLCSKPETLPPLFYAAISQQSTLFSPHWQALKLYTQAVQMNTDTFQVSTLTGPPCSSQSGHSRSKRTEIRSSPSSPQRDFV